MEGRERLKKKTAEPHAPGLELVRQNQVGVSEQFLVLGHDVGRDVDLAAVAHDRVKHPEEAARAAPSAGAGLEVLPYAANGLDAGGARNVA